MVLPQLAFTITHQPSSAPSFQTTTLATPVNSTQQHPSIPPRQKRARITNRSLPHPTADPPARLPVAQMPYTGDYHGFCWNTQALFASRVSQQEAKQHHAWTILRDHDFGGLLETHGATGTVAASSLPRHSRFFWAHGTSQHAGVGLAVKETFLREFNPVLDSNWKILVAGRVGRLQLRGARGAMDLYVLYLPTGSEATAERAQIMHTINEAVAPRSKVLSLLFGDFNYVECDRDRWNKDQSEWTGKRDANDVKEFENTLHRHQLFHEIHQPAFTHENAMARSRLDRVYSNHFISDQLDRSYTCTALQWTPLSAHRPISFARNAPKRSLRDVAKINSAAVRHPDWARRTTLDYQERLSRDPDVTNPARRLVLLKRSVHQGGLYSRINGMRRPTWMDNVVYQSGGGSEHQSHAALHEGLPSSVYAGAAWRPEYAHP